MRTLSGTWPVMSAVPRHLFWGWMLFLVACLFRLRLRSHRFIKVRSRTAHTTLTCPYRANVVLRLLHSQHLRGLPNGCSRGDILFIENLGIRNQETVTQKKETRAVPEERLVAWLPWKQRHYTVFPGKGWSFVSEFLLSESMPRIIEARPAACQLLRVLFRIPQHINTRWGKKIQKMLIKNHRTH